jgi:hypothetical protein
MKIKLTLPVLVCLLGVAVLSAPAQTAFPVPVPVPAVAPATPSPVPVPVPAVAPATPSSVPMEIIATAEFVEQRLKRSDREKSFCVSVRDGVMNCDEGAFYVLMDKVSQIPAMPAAEVMKIENPSYDNLLRKPDRYRYQPVRIKARLTAYETWSEDNDVYFQPAGYWPKSKPMYRLTMNLAGAKLDTPPLIVYCEHLPENLPRPKRAKEDDRRWFYGHKVAPVFTIVGMFYKVTAEETQTKATMMVPNLLVWQFAPENPAKPAVVINKGAKDKAEGYASIQLAIGVLIVAVLVVLGFLMFLKKKVLPKYRREVGTFQGYSPMRDLDQERRDRQTQREEEDQPVDSSLVAAAQSWRTDHGLSIEDTLDDLPADQPKDQ